MLIRNASSDEIRLIVDLSANEGWNPGLSDHDFFYRADPNGFILFLNDNQIIGSIASIEYSNDYGFIGFHIVQEQFRTKGYGRKLLEVAIDRLGKRNIGLNCLETQQDFYKNYEFTVAERIFIYEGIANGKLDIIPNIMSPFTQSFDELYEYDQKYFPADRKLFLASWTNQPLSLLMGKYVDNKYLGYGLIRPCLDGYKIAPLFAEDIDSAEEILNTLVGHIPEGSKFSINIPESNKNGIALAEKLKLKKTKTYLRMYSNSKPDISINNTYGFTSLELG